MAYKHINSKGVTYFLNKKEVSPKGQAARLFYFFSKDEREDTGCDLPEGYEILETGTHKLPCLKKIR